jgi:hypothetical protein
MSYTNMAGKNPIQLSNSIELRSGTSATAEAVTDEYIALGYEPGVGTIYQSSSGNIYVHTTAGTDANDWSKITDVPEPDIESYSVTADLTPILKIATKAIRKKTVTLTPTVKAKTITSKGATVTLTANLLNEPQPVVSDGITLTVTMGNKAIAAIRKDTVTLTPTIGCYIEEFRRNTSVTLSASRIPNRIYDVTATLTPTITKKVTSTKNESISFTIECIKIKS